MSTRSVDHILVNPSTSAADVRGDLEQWPGAAPQHRRRQVVSRARREGTCDLAVMRSRICMYNKNEKTFWHQVTRTNAYNKEIKIRLKLTRRKENNL